MTGTLYITEARLTHGKPVPKGTVDVSVLADMNAGGAFAPSRQSVQLFEMGELSWEDFSQEYEKVLSSLASQSLAWLFQQALWNKLANGEYVGELRLGCYCSEVRRCHVRCLITWLCRRQPFAGFRVRYLGTALIRLAEELLAEEPARRGLRRRALLGTPYWILEQNPAKESIFAWGSRNGVQLFWVMLGDTTQGNVVVKFPGDETFRYMTSWKLRGELLRMQRENRS